MLSLTPFQRVLSHSCASECSQHWHGHNSPRSSPHPLVPWLPPPAPLGVHWPSLFLIPPLHMLPLPAFSAPPILPECMRGGGSTSTQRHELWGTASPLGTPSPDSTSYLALCLIPSRNSNRKSKALGETLLYILFYIFYFYCIFNLYMWV